LNFGFLNVNKVAYKAEMGIIDFMRRLSRLRAKS
jgi:hypothetical protein